MALLVNDSVQIAYDDAGPENAKAAPVLLLHASGASRRQWRSFVEAESARRRCVAPDRIGYGETADRSGRASSMVREMAVVDQLRALAGGPVHLVGHSYGGAVAAAYAQAHAGDLLSLTLIEPVLFHLLRYHGPSAQWDEIARLASSHIAHVEAPAKRHRRKSGGRQRGHRHDHDIAQLHDRPDEHERQHGRAVEHPEHGRLGCPAPVPEPPPGRRAAGERHRSRQGDGRPVACGAARGRLRSAHTVSGTSVRAGSGVRRAAPRLVALPEDVGAQPDRDRQHVGQRAEDQHAPRPPSRAVAAGGGQPGDEREFDDAQPARGERDGGQQPGEGEDGERLDPADLVAVDARRSAATAGGRGTARGG